MRASLITVLIAFAVAGCASDEDDAREASGSSTAASTTGTTMSESGLAEVTSSPAPRADLGVEPSTTCEGYCLTSSDCLGASEADCLLGCSVETDERGEIGTDCQSAFETTRECAAQLGCDAFAEYQTAQGDYPCAPEDQQAALTCSLGGEPPPELCTAFCTTVSDCGFQEVDACTVACVETQAAADAVDATCAQAQQDVLTCAAALDCAALTDWLEGIPENLCATQEAAVAELCIGE